MPRPKRSVSLITCARLPETDPDAELLVDCLAAAGLDAHWTAWDELDGAGVLASYPAGVPPVGFLRSTWNYAHHLEAFLGWCDAFPGRLTNSATLVRWNSHKRYLLDLAGVGIATVPTAVVTRGQHEALDGLATRFGTADLVVKPAVSAGSFRTFRSRGRIADIEGEYAALVRDRDTLVQPYVPTVDQDYGERALVVLGGIVTHAVRKSPRFSGDHERVTRVEVTDEEAEFARRVLAAVPAMGAFEAPVYARVDVTRLPTGGGNGSEGPGRLAGMELELIEPSLFLAQSTEGLWRFVELVEQAVRAASGERGRRASAQEEEP